jgi:hypothetical protein
MSDDELAAELRRHLQQRARQPAPESLVRRVTATPATTSVSRSAAGTWRGLALVGAIAAALVLAVALGERNPTPDAGGSAPLPLPPSVASPSGGASPASGVAPPPSPSGLATPAPLGTFGSDIVPLAVRFSDPLTGWALGAFPCPDVNRSAVRCPVILGTTTGGRSWLVVNRPEIPLSGVVASGEEGPAPGIGELTAASGGNLWLWGPDLWASHDGGRTWTEVVLPGGVGMPVVDLVVGSERVYAAVFDLTTEPAARVFSAPLDGDRWQVEPVSVPLGAGPVPEAQLVSAGNRLWFLQVDRAVVGGARLDGTHWTSWSPPCLDSAGPAAIAAAGGDHLAALCDVGVWASPAGLHLFLSTDGGTTVTAAGDRLPAEGASLRTFAHPAPDTLVVAGSQAGRPVILASFDAGQSWREVWRWDAQSSEGVGIVGIQFLDAHVGFALAQVIDPAAVSGPGGPWPVQGILLATEDGGASWAPIASGP